VKRIHKGGWGYLERAPTVTNIDTSNWRPALLSRLRALILAADPEMVEVVKWRKPTNPAGVPVFEHDGIVCTGETYKDKVKLTFAHGASLPDPKRLFNSSLDAGTRRAIDFPEGATIDEAAFNALVRAAVAFNVSKKKAKASSGDAKAAAANVGKAKPRASSSKPPRAPARKK
jgi:hypothetical protein